MGCDIHFNTEIKKNGVWRQNTDAVFPNPDYELNGKYDWQKEKFTNTPPNGRRYDWFSVLANVRNGTGFAGHKTGSGFSVIANPRDVPADATKEWKEYVEKWGYDLHSVSYLSINDFDNFDWNQITMKSGVITLEQYTKLKENADSPESWCGYSSGPKIIIVSMKDADKIIKGEIKELTYTNKYRPEDDPVTMPIDYWDISVEYKWPVVYSEWFCDSIKNTVEPLRKLSEKHEDARIMFGFDN